MNNLKDQKKNIGRLSKSNYWKKRKFVNIERFKWTLINKH